jgi:hypothetical protein
MPLQSLNSALPQILGGGDENASGSSLIRTWGQHGKRSHSRLTLKGLFMTRFFLLGLAALGLIALAPTQSRADDGFRVYIGPAYQQDRPYYYREDYPRYRYYRHQDEYRGQRWHRSHHRYYYDRYYYRD